MRTCSVCGSEIDKNTAYTVSGEQKAQGRRCINCVDGAESQASVASATPEVTAAPQAAPAQPTPEPVVPKVEPTVSAPTDDAPKGISKTTYIIAAIAVIIVLIALD